MISSNTLAIMSPKTSKLTTISMKREVHIISNLLIDLINPQCRVIISIKNRDIQNHMIEVTWNRDINIKFGQIPFATQSRKNGMRIYSNGCQQRLKKNSHTLAVTLSG